MSILFNLVTVQKKTCINYSYAGFFIYSSLTVEFMSAKSVTELEKEAKQQVTAFSPEQVNDEVSHGNATLIDLRESQELE